MATLRERISNVFKKKEKAPAMSGGEGKILIKPSEESQFTDKSKVQVVTKAPTPTTTLKQALTKSGGSGGSGGGSSAKVQLAPEVEQKIVTQRAESYLAEQSRKAELGKQVQQGYATYAQRQEQQKQQQSNQAPLISQQRIQQKFGGAEQREEYRERQKEKEEKRKVNISAAISTGTGAQYFKTGFGQSKLSEKQRELRDEGGFVNRLNTFYNPAYQFSIAKYNEQLRYDLKNVEAESAQKQIQLDIERYNIYQTGITEGQLRTENVVVETPAQLTAIEKYNLVAEKPFSITTAESYGRIIGSKDLYQEIAESDLSEGKKYALSATLGGTQRLTYQLIPGVRAIMGVDLAKTGIITLSEAETKREKWTGAGQIALGSILAYSGAKGSVLKGTGAGIKFTGTPIQIAAAKTGINVLQVGAIGGLGYLDYTTMFKRTGDFSTSLGYAVGGGAASLSAMISPKIAETSLFGKKPKQIIPTEEMKEQVQPFTRQRATVMLKDIKGRYILGKTKSGEIISIGGGIEKGQTPRTAALAELRQETGLSLKDISNFKSAGKVVTPEETFYLYTGQLKGGIKLQPGSDINKLVYISPNNIFIRGSTGQTAFQPISRFTNVGPVRSYEAGIINYLEKGVSPTWLSISTKQGEFFLGTQSRYDVPYSSQKQYLTTPELKLASGTTRPAVISLTGVTKEFTVKGEFTQRGQAEGLYLQPPISSVKEAPGYIGLSYVGFNTNQKTEILLGQQYPTRAAFLYQEPPRLVSITPKTISGMESELILEPGTVSATKGAAEIASIGLKRVYLQPMEIISAEKIGTTSSIPYQVSYSNVEYLPTVSLSSYAPTYTNLDTSKISYTSNKKISYSTPSISQVSSVAKTSSSPASRSSKPSKNIISEPVKYPESPISKISSPSKSISYYVPSSKTYKSNYPTPSPKEVSSGFGFKLPKASQLTTKTGKYPVLIRRFGKFKIIGYGKTPGQAVSIGKSAVGTTLARTFKVPSFKGFKVAGFKTKKSKKEGLVFIEPSARALSTRSEQKEIKLYKQLKFKSNVRR